jgi:hypothetical protein
MVMLGLCFWTHFLLTTDETISLYESAFPSEIGISRSPFAGASFGLHILCISPCSSVTTCQPDCKRLPHCLPTSCRSTACDAYQRVRLEKRVDVNPTGVRPRSEGWRAATAETCPSPIEHPCPVGHPWRWRGTDRPLIALLSRPHPSLHWIWVIGSIRRSSSDPPATGPDFYFSLLMRVTRGR